MIEFRNSLSIRTHSGEPFSTFIIEKLEFTPLGFGMLCFVLSFVVPLILCFINNSAYPQVNDGLESFLESPTTYLFRLWMIPLASILMLLFYERTSSILNGLRLSNAIECSDETYKKLTAQLERRLRSPLVLIISLTFAGLALWDIIAKGGSPGSFMAEKSWSDLWSVAGIYNVFVLDAGMFYFSAQILIRATVFLLWSKRLFKNSNVRINLNIANPDGEGGVRSLKEIRNVVYPFVFLVGLGGPIDLAMRMSSFTEPLSLVFIISYILLGSMAFFAPLLPTREHLTKAWEQYQTSIQQIMAQEKVHDVKQIKEYKDMLTFSKYWGNKVCFPYNLNTLVLFLVVIGIPVLLMLLVEILKYLK